LEFLIGGVEGVGNREGEDCLGVVFAGLRLVLADD